MTAGLSDDAIEAAAAAADRGNPHCIVQRNSDGTFAYRNGDDVIELGATLPGAVSRLDEMGIVATHWLPKGEHSSIAVIPGGVSRPLISPEQRARLPKGW